MLLGWEVSYQSFKLALEAPLMSSMFQDMVEDNFHSTLLRWKQKLAIKGQEKKVQFWLDGSCDDSHPEWLSLLYVLLLFLINCSLF